MRRIERHAYPRTGGGGSDVVVVPARRAYVSVAWHRCGAWRARGRGEMRASKEKQKRPSGHRGPSPIRVSGTGRRGWWSIAHADWDVASSCFSSARGHCNITPQPPPPHVDETRGRSTTTNPFVPVYYLHYILYIYVYDTYKINNNNNNNITDVIEIVPRPKRTMIYLLKPSGMFERQRSFRNACTSTLWTYLVRVRGRSHEFRLLCFMFKKSLKIFPFKRFRVQKRN